VMSCCRFDSTSATRQLLLAPSDNSSAGDKPAKARLRL
jgi:hypothetical protein